MAKPTVLFSMAALAAVSLIQTAHSAVIFADDFESGNLDNWTTTVSGGTGLTVTNTSSAVPVGGVYSAALDNTSDRMHRNLGQEVDGAAVFSFYFYDSGITNTTRLYAEVRGYSGGSGIPNGGTTASGTLSQLLAIGRYNTVTLPGDTYDATKYQARVTFGSSAGWFNLNADGAPSRSEGWHRFDIERLADGTTLNFYVDGILGRTIAGATAETWDTILLGSALGTAATTANFDGVRLETIPEPSTSFLAGFSVLAALTGRRGRLRRR